MVGRAHRRDSRHPEAIDLLAPSLAPAFVVLMTLSPDCYQLFRSQCSGHPPDTAQPGIDRLALYDRICNMPGLGAGQ